MHFYYVLPLLFDQLLYSLPKPQEKVNQKQKSLKDRSEDTTTVMKRGG